MDERRLALEWADGINRLEGFERTKATTHLFDEWVEARLSSDELLARLLEHHRGR